MPYLAFIEKLPFLFLAADHLKYVSSVRVLHHNTQTVRRVFEKGFFVADDVRVVDACQDSYLVQSVFFLSATQLVHFYLFHRVYCLV